MESDNQSCSGAVAAGGRLLVDESSSNVQKDRKRFQIELKHGETTIVSWVKLLKESGISVDCPPPSPEPPMEYGFIPRDLPNKRKTRSQEWFHEEDELRSECPNIFVNEEQNSRSPMKEHCQPKKQRTNTSQVLERINVVQVIKNSKIGHTRVKSSTGVNCNMKLKLRSDCGMTCDEAAVCCDISEEHPVINGRNELPDLNVPYTVQATSTSPRHIKDECCGILLKSSILAMEAMVAEARQLDGDVEDSVATKSRLPPEIKQKLETIARLAHSNQGRISDELIMRIMSQLGHWLKPRTLKRWLRDMVPSDLSSWDAVQLIQIKKEVPQMIKSVETKDKSSNETMELQATHKTKYSMDHEMEDKICDFYDIYVQGTKEIKNSEIRKFYIQLAQLWPKGTMDNHGIRNAICRAKERRRTLLQEKGHEKGMGKKSISQVDDNLHEETNLVAEPGKLVNDHNALILNCMDTDVPSTPELNRNLGPPAKRFSPPSGSA